MKDEIKFKEYMLILGEIFDKEISNGLTGIYWNTLERFTDDQCKAAFGQIIQTAKFFPKPSEFVEILAGKREHQATLAWMQTDEAARRYGPYESVSFTDKVIHSVVQVMGGWPKLMDCTMDEWKWRQKEFERLYSIISANGGNHPDHLPGIHERENEGFKGKIIQFGDSERKRLTYVD